MRTSLLALTSAIALAAVAAAPSLPTALDSDQAPIPDGCRLVDVLDTPDDDTDDVTLCEQQLFVRAGDAPLGNAASAVFSLDAPELAPVGGAAAGSSITDIVIQGDPAHGLEVSGTFSGAVDTVDVEVYVATPLGLLGNHGVTPAIEIDGFNFGGQQLDATVSAGPRAGISVVRFRIGDMLDLWPLLSFSYDADVEHTLRVNLSPFYFGDDGAYLYDGTDVPSNVVLNAAP